MADYTIREATLADYRDVMAFGDIYRGVDYLPDLYEEFIQNPDYHCFVCLVDGNIIGFLAAFVIDGGTAFDLRAGRVKETHRGRGYFRALREHIYSLMGHMGTIKYEKVVNFHESAKSLLQPGSGFDLLAKQKVIEFEIPEGVGSDVASDLQPLTTNNLEDALSCPSAREILFPDGLIHIHRIPFSAEAANLKNFFDKRTVMFGSKTHQGNLALISTGRYFNVRLGFRYWVEFIGAELDDFIQHILAHLAHIRTLSSKTVYVAIALDPRLPESRLEEVEHLGARRRPSVAEDEYTFRRKL